MKPTLVSIRNVRKRFATVTAVDDFSRIAAGRVFRLAMLMYGKEPTWAEVRQWIVR